MRECRRAGRLAPGKGGGRARGQEALTNNSGKCVSVLFHARLVGTSYLSPAWGVLEARLVHDQQVP